MWALDVLSVASGTVEDTFYLVAGEWSIGRKKCHFNFHADASISRTHALLRVGTLSPEQLKDPTTRPSLVLEDQGSRFGSFVNQEQCFHARELKNGDHVSFGAKRTILRVRYQVFILVASRIQRSNRVRVSETCQRIGMHLVASESKDATHCIMDPGRIVATVKVLWALVYNQPVVCTPWLYAIAARKSMSEPLPRCDEFLPTDEHVPAVASNYLPNAMRKTLYHRHVVVFLTPQSMEDIVAAMAGVVVAAYRDAEHDELLLRAVEQHAASRYVLVVEPLQLQTSGFSSAAASSDGREPQSVGPGNINNSNSSSACAHSAVERRVALFRSIGASFVTVQELAASVIFVKTPATASEFSFSSSLAGHHQSSSVQICSFPDHLSLPAPSATAPSIDRDADNTFMSSDHDRVSSRSTAVGDRSSHVVDSVEGVPTRLVDTVSSNSVDATGRETAATALLLSARGGASRESVVQVKDEPSAAAAAHELRVKEEATPVQFTPMSSISISDYPAADSSSQMPSSNVLSLEPVAKTERLFGAATVNGTRRAGSADNSAGWVATLSSTQQRVGDQKVNSDDDVDDNDSAPKPVVVSCSLVVTRPTGGCASARASASSSGSGVNFKRFRKGNGLVARPHTPAGPQAAAAVAPPRAMHQPTVVSVTVDNADRVALEANLEALEEQERIADELFAMAENRAAKRRL